MDCANSRFHVHGPGTVALARLRIVVIWDLYVGNVVHAGGTQMWDYGSVWEVVHCGTPGAIGTGILHYGHCALDCLPGVLRRKRVNGSENPIDKYSIDQY